MASKRALYILLFACLGLRLWTLEYPDLMDPTESRYAFVAQEMYLTGDWVVPKIPWRGEIEPYLGKPPLHFWLTALSFSLFNMEEWAARMPSFLSIVVMCIALASLRRIEKFQKLYITGMFILLSSGLMFFMGGASVVDVTLTACTTVAFSALLLLSTEKISRSIGGAILFAALSLGFLTKGPIALVIVGFPVCIWMVLTQNFRFFKQVPWILGIAIFSCITAPWFILAERTNPGFIRYFFVNENFQRFLFKEYGDRYGTGHRYPFGTAWGMFLVSFMPWTFPLVEIFARKWRELLRLSFWRQEPLLLFCLLWGLSPALIFTLARQLNFAYVLPGVPGMALVAAELLGRYPSPYRKAIYAVLGTILVLIGFGGFGYGLTLGLSTWMLCISTLPLAFLFYTAYHFKKSPTEVYLAALTIATFCVFVTSLAEPMGERRSTQSILRCLTHTSPLAKPTIGIVNVNSYSIYYYSRAWREELSKPVEVLFLRSDKLPAKLPQDIIIRSNEWKELKPFLPATYRPVVAAERWMWLRDTGDINYELNCPS